ncbi:MAG TPA: dTDP-4-dehydrorhamnose reductase [Xanthobacteraceae bacterium]
MRILVTGVTGQVGGALVARLRPPLTVLAADRAMLDLSRPDALAAVLDRLAPTIIVNTAAYTNVDQAETEPALAATVNAEAPGAIARWAAARAVPLIHLSTDFVFSGAGARPWREEDAPQPLSVYGATKLAGENQIRAAGGSFLILRTSWVYAARAKNFVRTIARLAQERSELRIVADQIGALTSAGLLAEAIAGILAGDVESVRQRCAQAGGLVHFAAAGAASRHEIACTIVDGLRARGRALAVERVLPVSSAEYPSPAKRPLNSRFDLTRWRTVFNQTPPPWQTVLAPVLDEIAAGID